MAATTTFGSGISSRFTERRERNLTAMADLNGDGRPDLLVAAMNLQNTGYLERGSSGKSAGTDPILLFENRTQRASRTGSP